MPLDTTSGACRVMIYTDGACLGNPGPGGYGAVLVFGDKRRELSGGRRETTNNRMELMAVIEALATLTRPCQAEVVTDSKYVCDAIEKKWLAGWQKKGWKTATKTPVKNQDLWRLLIPLLAAHTVKFTWVRGHSGHTENERCDVLAKTAAGQTGLQRDEGYV